MASAWAIERGYEAATEMDADGSHQPEQPQPAAGGGARRSGHRRAVGQRWVRSSTGPRTARRFSGGANIYTKVMLGLPVNDATGGYRVYRTRRCRRWTWPR
ncbi:MAG: hypothetical protein IPH27_14895 [Actinomycetales bacterium]|nr:hypothetical protein [Candidatus Phosphoribacter baldrii]